MAAKKKAKAKKAKPKISPRNRPKELITHPTVERRGDPRAFGTKQAKASRRTRGQDTSPKVKPRAAKSATSSPVVSTSTITRLSELLLLVDKFDDQDEILFRGQSKAWPLLPKIARQRSRHDDLLAAERMLLEQFRQISIPHLRGHRKPGNDLEWLCLAQHHGLPTRLLDWTRNPLTALWFTVRKPPDTTNANGVLWIYKPTDADQIDANAALAPLKVTRTGVVNPDHITARLVAQGGAFTLHAFFEDHATFVPLEKNQMIGGELTRVLVPSRSFSYLRYSLDRVGINDAAMFPDLTGIADYVTWRHTMLEDEE